MYRAMSKGWDEMAFRADLITVSRLVRNLNIVNKLKIMPSRLMQLRETIGSIDLKRQPLQHKFIQDDTVTIATFS